MEMSTVLIERVDVMTESTDNPREVISLKNGEELMKVIRGRFRISGGV
jgi:hypothetical protein